MPTKLLIVALTFALSTITAADTIILNNGRRIEVERAWEEGGQIKGSIYGATIGYPKEQIESIERKREYRRDEKEMLGFDVWNLGMGIEEVINVSERNDIPLRKEGLIGSYKHFHPSVRKHAQSAIQFYYDCELLRRWAKVKLNFTPISKQLSKITVQWRGLNANNHIQFKAEIEELLINKYGAPMRRFKENLFFEKTVWEVQKTGTISIRSSRSAVDVEYSDKGMVSQEQARSKKSKGMIKRLINLKIRVNFKTNYVGHFILNAVISHLFIFLWVPIPTNRLAPKFVLGHDSSSLYCFGGKVP